MVKTTRTQAEPPVFEEELLLEWVRNVLADQKFPIKITVSVDRNGVHSIEQYVDGRKVRGEFIDMLTNQFFKRTGIVPPPKSKQKNKSFTKLWVNPMEAMLRQAVYRGGISYDQLKGKDKYNKLHVATFSYLVKDSWEKAEEGSLTIAAPLSLEKIGISVASSGSHYRTAVRFMESYEANGNR